MYEITVVHGSVMPGPYIRDVATMFRRDFFLLYRPILLLTSPKSVVISTGRKCGTIIREVPRAQAICASRDDCLKYRVCVARASVDILVHVSSQTRS